MLTFFVGETAIFTFVAVAMVALVVAAARNVQLGAYALIGIAAACWLLVSVGLGWLLLIGGVLAVCLMPSRKVKPVSSPAPKPTPNLDRVAELRAAPAPAPAPAPARAPAPAAFDWDAQARKVPRPDGPRSAWEQMNEVAHG